MGGGGDGHGDGDGDYETGLYPSASSSSSSSASYGPGPSFTFTTNPCRIRFFTREIVVFRGEVSTRLRKRALLPPVSDEEVRETYDHAVKTVLDQGHLCPLPLSLQPIHWAYDYALRLSPLPDALVFAEDGEARKRDTGGTLVFSPGSFASPTGPFTVYYPAKREVELCEMDPAPELEHDSGAAAIGGATE